MPNEIERRFLLKDPNWLPTGSHERLTQGYFWLGETATARIEQGPSNAFRFVLTVKGSKLSYSMPLPARHGAELKKKFNRSWTVRVRHSSNHDGFLTLKGKAKGLSRPEYEYPLSEMDSLTLLSLCRPTHVVKDRYCRNYRGFVWEVDIYQGGLKGHATCEVELKNERQKPALPEFVGTEVTRLKGFTAAALARSQKVPAYPKAA